MHAESDEFPWPKPGDILFRSDDHPLSNAWLDVERLGRFCVRVFRGRQISSLKTHRLRFSYQARPSPCLSGTLDSSALSFSTLMQALCVSAA